MNADRVGPSLCGYRICLEPKGPALLQIDSFTTNSSLSSVTHPHGTKASPSRTRVFFLVQSACSAEKHTTNSRCACVASTIYFLPTKTQHNPPLISHTHENRSNTATTSTTNKQQNKQGSDVESVKSRGACIPLPPHPRHAYSTTGPAPDPVFPSLRTANESAPTRLRGPPPRRRSTCCCTLPGHT